MSGSKLDVYGTLINFQNFSQLLRYMRKPDEKLKKNGKMYGTTIFSKTDLYFSLSLRDE